MNIQRDLRWWLVKPSQGLSLEGDRERGDRDKYQMPGFLGPYKGKANYHSPGYGGDKAKFTEERADKLSSPSPKSQSPKSQSQDQKDLG